MQATRRTLAQIVLIWLTIAPISAFVSSAERWRVAEGYGMREEFRKFASTTSRLVGSPWAFVVAMLLIIGWALSGPIFGFSDTWQLVINTTTTIITFLMVFLIQNTQNRDAEAIHLKLDELIRAIHTARTRLVDLEDLSDEQLDELREEFQKIRELHRNDGDHEAMEVDGSPPLRRATDPSARRRKR